MGRIIFADPMIRGHLNRQAEIQTLFYRDEAQIDFEVREVSELGVRYGAGKCAFPKHGIG
jgi:hypothetical protein